MLILKKINNNVALAASDDGARGQDCTASVPGGSLLALGLWAADF